MIRIIPPFRWRVGFAAVALPRESVRREGHFHDRPRLRLLGPAHRDWPGPFLPSGFFPTFSSYASPKFMFLSQHLVSKKSLPYPYALSGARLYARDILILAKFSSPKATWRARTAFVPTLATDCIILHVSRVDFCEPRSRAATNSNSREGLHSLIL